MSGIHTSARLFYCDGSSDKEYHAAINEVEDGYTVTFAFGRRGSALSAGTKTSAPVSLEKATQIYDKLLAEKTAKGYTPDGSGALFAMTENENRVSGLHPQLLNSVDPDAARQYLDDDDWCAQEKFDGKRIMVAVTAGSVAGSNRKGLYVSMPQEISDALAGLPDCELDGELLGDCYVVFDLLKFNDNSLRPRPYRERYEALASVLGASSQVRVAETAWDAAAKQALYARVAQAGGEGIVFKKKTASASPDDPHRVGHRLSAIYATCTCLVAAQNDQRSVRLALLDEDRKPVGVGNVTIPSSKTIPPAGALVEIRYLYAYKGGSLYQPAYIGERDDLSPEECVLEQLKYKPAGYQSENEEAFS